MIWGQVIFILVIFQKSALKFVGSFGMIQNFLAGTFATFLTEAILWGGLLGITVIGSSNSLLTWFFCIRSLLTFGQLYSGYP